MASFLGKFTIYYVQSPDIPIILGLMENVSHYTTPSPMGTIRIAKHARQTSSDEDGWRVLVTRWWPRGLSKTSIHAWIRELAPSSELLRQYKGVLNPVQNRGLSNITFDEFSNRYIAEMAAREAKRAHLEILDKISSGQTVSLLCVCHRPEHCHRSLLQMLISKKLGFHNAS